MAKPTKSVKTVSQSVAVRPSLSEISEVFVASVKEAVKEYFAAGLHTIDPVFRNFPTDWRDDFYSGTGRAQELVLDAYRLGAFREMISSRLGSSMRNLVRLGRVNLPDGSKDFTAELRSNLEDLRGVQFVDVTFYAADTNEEVDED